MKKKKNQESISFPYSRASSFTSTPLCSRPCDDALFFLPMLCFGGNVFFSSPPCHQVDCFSSGRCPVPFDETVGGQRFPFSIAHLCRIHVPSGSSRTWKKYAGTPQAAPEECALPLCLSLSLYVGSQACRCKPTKTHSQPPFPECAPCLLP